MQGLCGFCQGALTIRKVCLNGTMVPICDNCVQETEQQANILNILTGGGEGDTPEEEDEDEETNV